MRRSFGIVSASALAALFAFLGQSPFAFAQATGASSDTPVSPLPPDALTGAPEASSTTILPEAPLEAPPPPPRKKGVVIESRLGALAFLGDFRHVAPTSPWFQADVGYEFLKWLAVFGYGELSFTDTGGTTGQANTFAFPIYGFGGAVRATVHATPRVAFFLEGDAGAMRADVPRGALAYLGYANAETFGASFGGRFGAEWYQVDRHLAFSLDVGVRDAPGFAEQYIGTGPPLMLDASLAIRYTF